MRVRRLLDRAVPPYWDSGLLAFIQNASLGQCRIYFLRPINRIGNRIKDGQGRMVIESVVEDPVLGKEATAILNGRSRNQ